MPKYKNTLSRVIAAVYPAGGGRNGKPTKAPPRQHGPKRLVSRIDLKALTAETDLGRATRLRWSRRKARGVDMAGEIGDKQGED